jgi:uncharacterized protein (TIGR02757 family)
MIGERLGERLNSLFDRCHRRDLVHPDPLEFLYDYPDLYDREIVGLIAAALAYGRVKQILVSVSRVLDSMPSPSRFLESANEEAIREALAPFRHRFTSGEDLVALLIAVKHAKQRHGSLLNCFLLGLKDSDESVVPALGHFVKELRLSEHENCGGFLATPEDGSACKRLNLFLRWLVRRDNVDPGGWEIVGAGRLIIPVDTHVARIGRQLGLTHRNAADLRMAMEITESLRRFDPNDPVKYDFVLSRLGIRDDMDEESFLAGDEGALLCAPTRRLTRSGRAPHAPTV